MAQSKFLELMRGVLVRAGMLPGDAAITTYNTLRRFLPTAGDTLAFSDSEMQSISNWTDLPQSKSTGDGVQRKGNQLTSRIYAADKVTSAALNRFKAIIACQAAASAVRKAAGSVKVDRGSITWDNIRLVRHKLEDFAVLADGGYPGASENFEDNNLEEFLEEMSSDKKNMESEVKESVEDGFTRDDISSDSGGTSEPNSSEAGSEEEETWRDQSQWPTPFSVRGGVKWHLQLFLGEAGSIPYCRSSPFKTYRHQDKEELMDKIISSEVCERCWKKAPKAWRSALMRMNQDEPTSREEPAEKVANVVEKFDDANEPDTNIK
jgi:hypothetical protein